MRSISAILLFLLSACGGTKAPETVTGPKGEVFVRRIVADRLSDPWEITYGPDQSLWVTEAKGYRVSRVDPASGKRTVVLDVSGERKFSRYDLVKEEKKERKPWPQGGLMGLALHPQFGEGKPYVFLSYVYRFAGAGARGSGCADKYGGCFFSTRIVRYRYDAPAGKLIDPVVLCDTIPGSNDHNGGRLLIAPEGDRPYLFYAVGDMGAGQFDNGGRPNHAQDVRFYEGKILRFHTEPDGDANAFDRWIPNDNPFNGQRQSAVWTYGHRNPQGLAFAGGKIYSSEHGPYSDDEVNLIEKAGNYGHPLIEGYADGNYNGLAAGATDHKELPGAWNTTYPDIISEQATATALGAAYRNPLKSFYPTRNSTLRKVLVKTRDGERGEWVSEAPSSIDVYTSPAIPGWRNSLLLSTLKTGRLLRLPLNENGDGLTGDTLVYFQAMARYRDIALSPDGRRIYLAVDSAKKSSGPTEDKEKKSFCQGCIVEFTYTGNGAEIVRSKAP
ncbi:PQQ-dependent sugar dehydrogenase [Paraflavisolibacter sp. H34]|uniref:PQQ-dependent sugar dehydrogenase n=1 Tax=Huijunlia imazamoxiresistens TaxID=3127457 RepID=UPI003015C6F0